MEQGSRAAGERELLVDHRQNSAIAGIDGDHGAIHISQGVDGGFAHHRIFTRGVIARSRITRERGGGKALVIANSSLASLARGNHRSLLLPALLATREWTARLCRDAAMRFSVFALSLILRLLRAS